MATSMMINIPTAQWRLVNVLHRLPAKTIHSSWPAGAAVTRAGSEMIEVWSLMEQELLEAVHAEHRAGLPVGPWYALQTLARKCGPAVRLDNVVQELERGTDPFVTLHERGLAVISSGGTAVKGENIGQAFRDAPAEVLGAYLIEITPYGQDLAGARPGHVMNLRDAEGFLRITEEEGISWRDIHIRLTSAGNNWATGNSRNVALEAVWMAARRSASHCLVRDALREAGPNISVNTLVELAGPGLHMVSILDPSSSEVPDESLAHTAPRMAKQAGYRIGLTKRGKRTLAINT